MLAPRHWDEAVEPMASVEVPFSQAVQVVERVEGWKAPRGQGLHGSSPEGE